MRVHSFLVLALVGGALGIGAGCSNDVPPFPSYAKDIAPLMTAQCTRCHSPGNPKDPDMPPLVVQPGQPGVTQAIGDFTTMAGAQAACAPVLFNEFVLQIGMPPPPSSRLDDYSLELLERWCAPGQQLP